MQGALTRATVRISRRLLVLSAVAALAAVGAGAVPSGAGIEAPVVGSGSAYTVEVQVPNGLPTRCRLSTIDLATGVVTPVAPFVDDELGCASDLAFSPGGALYGISDLQGDEIKPPSVDDTTPTTGAPVEPAAVPDQAHLVRFDTTTGAVTDLGAIGTAESRVGFAGGITFDPSGNLFVYVVSDDAECGGDAYCLYQVDPANPASPTFLGSDPIETFLFGLTTACGTGMYTVEDTSREGSVEATDDVLVLEGGNQLDTVDPTPPAKATAVGSLIGRARTVQSIDFASDGTLWALGSVTPLGLPSAQLSVLDRTTGAQTMGPVLSGETVTLAVGLAIAAPSCPVEIQPNFTG